ncbi:TonB-dependent receptor plug domain-containing protein [Bizionia gelidisalsuginis]|uniref:TonB-dependent receptor plug domain-containing protein n=1 Tax=Bizionia gelidisalsuginis TaxID=291188 RepID=A0ABY3MAK6_9FLAO|nr:TonB-dependent receptor plug domain-containing protein [Bizionia gelidisalsuginis]TYC12804.1 TonB-dependent receptor plug domain-containing protein [Bizionia gelidisalsuginis]
MSNKRTLTFLFFLFVFNVCNIFSQTITDDRHPLVSVLEIIQERYTIRFSYADITIANKTSVLPAKNLELNDVLNRLERDCHLEFSVLNSRFIVIQPAKKNVTDIQKLDEVYLSDYLTSGISKTKAGGIAIRTKKFGILPGLIEPDILQTVQALPGVLSTDESVSNLNVRGGTHDQNLILWDGIKMYQSGHFFGLISSFTPNLTRKVEVSKNGTSAQFGDAVSSTIAMELDSQLNNEASGGLGLNLINFSGFGKVPITDKLEMQVSARRSITDVFETATYSNYFERVFQDTDITNSENTIKNDAFYFYDVNSKLIYKPSKKDQISLSATTTFNALRYIESPTGTSTNISSGIEQRNQAVGITYRRDWNSKFSTEAQAYVTHYKLDARNFKIENNQQLQQQNEVLETNLKLNTEFYVNPNLIWLNGIQVFEIGVSNGEATNNPPFKSRLKKIAISTSGYSEAIWSSTSNKTFIKAGLRANKYSISNQIHIEPRLSFSQKFLKYFKLEVLGEYKSQITSQVIDRQNDFLGIEKRRWVLANNTTIPTLKSKQASLGLQYKANKLLVSAEFYAKNVNGITTRSQGMQNQYQFVNAIGSYRVNGIDFLINKQFTNFSMWLSYSLSANDYTFETLNDGATFPNTTDITNALTFANTYTINNLKLALGFNWHTGNITTAPVVGNEVFDGNINYESPNSRHLKDYFRTDFSATFNFKFTETTKADIGVSIWNLFNTKNNLNTYYSIEPDDSILKIEKRSLGITPNVSFKLTF